MVTGLIGKKVGMTQLFAPDGTVYPATVLKAGPCVVSQVKTIENDGYEAVQLGLVEARSHKENKPTGGHFKKAGVPPTRVRREVRLKAGGDPLKAGDQVNVSIFSDGERVDVVGTSRGKGFQGVVKRYHWHGADMTHGSMIHRKPQSAGATDAARIFKGVGRPGHMGHERVTVRRLRIARVDAGRNVLLIRGAIPGPNGGLVSIREAK